MCKCQPPSQWPHNCLQGEWAGESLCIPFIWTCLTPPMVVSLLKIWVIQRKFYTNQKCLLWGLIMWYAPSSWWHRVPCLGNIHNTWWMRWSLEYPYSPPGNLTLQAPAPPPYLSDMCLATCTRWGRTGAVSKWLLRLWPHGRVEGTGFVVLCFVNFRNFHNSEKYGVARARLSEIYCVYEWNQRKRFPGASTHEKHDVKTSASEVHVQHKIWMLQQPTN